MKLPSVFSLAFMYVVFSLSLIFSNLKEFNNVVPFTSPFISKVFPLSKYMLPPLRSSLVSPVKLPVIFGFPLIFLKSNSASSFKVRFSTSNVLSFFSSIIESLPIFKFVIPLSSAFDSITK